MKDLKITALAGGIGAARFLQGLVRVIDPAKLTVIVNTADDIDVFGLHVSPDVDIVMYTLAGVVNPETGWGFQDDTFACLEQMRKLGYEDWFQLGDRDLAVHIHRTRQLRQGQTPTAVADFLRRRFSLEPRILPMSDDPVTTRIATDRGILHFQEYLVKRRAMDRVRRVIFTGLKTARPSPQVLEAIRRTDGIIICPSNPIVSIGPILGLKGVRKELRETQARIVAVSPIIGGKPVKGPAAKIMSGLGLEVSAAQVARLYRDFLDVFVIDERDRPLSEKIASLGLEVVVTDTLMKNLRVKTRLAQAACRALRG